MVWTRAHCLRGASLLRVTVDAVAATLLRRRGADATARTRRRCLLFRTRTPHTRVFPSHPPVSPSHSLAAQNFTSKAVMECLGSCLTNKYAEGLPFKRYYGGNEYIDQVRKEARAFVYWERERRRESFSAPTARLRAPTVVPDLMQRCSKHFAASLYAASAHQRSARCPFI